MIARAVSNNAIVAVPASGVFYEGPRITLIEQSVCDVAAGEAKSSQVSELPG
jgi:hypothetical protein